MASTADQQKQSRVDSGVVEGFCERYYEVFDTRRMNIDKFYEMQAKLIWNGTELNGRDAIAKHLIALPATRHHIHSLDFFPMKELFPDEPTTYQVFTSGAVAYGTPESSSVPKEKRLFSHVFVLTADVNSATWFIANECFRFHE